MGYEGFDCILDRLRSNLSLTEFTASNGGTLNNMSDQTHH